MEQWKPPSVFPKQALKLSVVILEDHSLENQAKE